MSGVVRIVIVEDDPRVRDFLVATVKSIADTSVVGMASTCAEGRALFGATEIDVLLLDLALPDGSGLDLIEHARRAAPSVRVLIVSGLGDAANVVSAIRRGADGYLLKGGDAVQAETAIRLVMAGGSPISPSVAGHILALVRDPVPNRELPSLTPRELELLQSLAKGFTYRELGELHGISAQTVAVHVKSIYRKLEVASRGEAVFEAAQLGLIKLQ